MNLKKCFKIYQIVKTCALWLTLVLQCFVSCWLFELGLTPKWSRRRRWCSSGLWRLLDLLLVFHPSLFLRFSFSFHSSAVTCWFLLFLPLMIQWWTHERIAWIPVSHTVPLFWTGLLFFPEVSFSPGNVVIHTWSGCGPNPQCCDPQSGASRWETDFLFLIYTRLCLCFSQAANDRNLRPDGGGAEPTPHPHGRIVFPQHHCSENRWVWLSSMTSLPASPKTHRVLAESFTPHTHSVTNSDLILDLLHEPETHTSLLDLHRHLNMDQTWSQDDGQCHCRDWPGSEPQEGNESKEKL